MNYKVGDRVKIKNRAWFIDNEKENVIKVNDYFEFTLNMTKYCDSILTIERIFEYEHIPYYKVEENAYHWTDEMIEGLAEEEILIERVDDNGLPFNEWLSHKGAFHVPNGYELKDENGNVINATKIVLEKKKKEYPKTYEECCEVLEISSSGNGTDGYKWEILTIFQNLIIYRDVYWKTAGDEMGLGKPWTPDWTSFEPKYIIYYESNGICFDEVMSTNTILAFPTPEMRDAFYENFKELIESVKELL